MYSFFHLSNTVAARMVAGVGALIITVVLMATAIVPATSVVTPETALLTAGVIA